MTRKAVVMIDGGYYDHVTSHLKDERGVSVDITKLSDALCDEFECEHLRTNLYHALPYPKHKDLDDEEKEEFGKKTGYFNAIDTEPNHQFVEAGAVKEKERYSPEADEYISTRTQTGTDVKLAVEMIDMAMKSEADIILLTGDGDMIPAIEQTKRHMSRVYVAYSEDVSVNNRLKGVADDHFDMSLHLLESCELEG